MKHIRNIAETRAVTAITRLCRLTISVARLTKTLQALCTINMAPLEACRSSRGQFTAAVVNSSTSVNRDAIDAATVINDNR